MSPQQQVPASSDAGRAPRAVPRPRPAAAGADGQRSLGRSSAPSRARRTRGGAPVLCPCSCPGPGLGAGLGAAVRASQEPARRASAAPRSASARHRFALAVLALQRGSAAGRQPTTCLQPSPELRCSDAAERSGSGHRQQSPRPRSLFGSSYSPLLSEYYAHHCTKSAVMCGDLEEGHLEKKCQL